MGGSSKKVTVGYKYYLGMHMILCHGPVDKVTRIEVDGKTAWNGNSTGGTISISAPNLFGGESREGGVSGTVDIEMGGPTQGKNSYLQGQLGSLIPAYRGVLGVVLRQVYVGLNPYLKRWAFWASRIHIRQGGAPQWYDEKAEINGDMNPAHILRECLTDPDWGMGYPDGDIDDTAFRAAADQLYSEGMGMSLLWDRSVTLEEFIQTILKHIDGSIYVDRSTGKFVLKLARGGYDINSLLVLDESSVDRITDFKRSTIGELVNSVTVVYWDASTGKNGSVTVQDIALAAQQQATIGTTVQFPGFTNGTIATRAAARTLKALSTPLASATIYANRKAASLNVGDVFVLTWPRFGVSQLVMRVTNIELGALESNLVKIQAIEDVFALSNAIYAAPTPSDWTNPNNPPAPCPYHCVIEAPFWELVQRMGEMDARALPATAGFVVATGVRPSSDASNAKLYTDVTGVWEEAGPVDFCPTAILTAAVSSNTTTFPIGAGVDLDIVQVGTYALIDSELVRIDAVSDTSLTVGRGVLDTVAKPHAVGARLFFADAFFESDGIEYATGEQADIRLLPSTGLGTLDLASAPTQSVAIVARQYKPYPPGQFRINGQAYPDAVRGDQGITVSWTHRDRLQQTATLVDETAGSIGPEAGTTYTLRIYGENDVLGRTYAGLTGTSVSYDIEDEKTDFALPGSGGLVGDAYWTDVKLLLHMNGADGSVTFTDSSAVARVLTVNGAVAIDVDQSQFGGASGLFPADDNGFLTAANSADFDFGSGDFTVEMWVRPSTATGRLQFILGTRPPFGGDRGWVMTIGSAGTLGFAGWGSSGATIVNISGGLMVAGTWQHVAVTRSGSTFRLFRDGTLVATASTAAAIGDSTAVLRFSGDPTTSGRYYAGHIDEVRITKGVARYVADFNVPTSAFPESGLVSTVGYRPNGLLRLELEAVRDGVVSLQKHEHTVVRYGYGFQYGKYFGGV